MSSVSYEIPSETQQRLEALVDRIEANQGRLVEQGSHDELLAKKGGVYARLYAVNYGLPIDDSEDERAADGGQSLTPAPADD